MKVFFGTDYYPEHCARENWETDIRLMKEMGLNVVRMAEFSWEKLEPAKGEYNFTWLDEAIALLGKEDIKVILGTPSAAPPAWIVEETPSIQPTDQQGRRRHFGGRHHDCQSHPVYREHIKRYITAFAAHFAENPNVIGWQVDNELGNSHNDLCMCEHCEARFREWLKNKYKNIETLNEKWGTVFWSQGYSSFEHIHSPKITVTGRNPSTVLDWRRFCSDLVVEFHHFQAELLRAAAPGKFITHNLMGFFDKVSYFDLAKDLDFSSHDQYPGIFHSVEPSQPPSYLAAALDLIRATKNAPFWIMEQQAGITGWEVMGRSPRPGQLGMWAAQSIAHGADCIVFFRWDTCAVGTEQYWHGILPHSRIPGRNYNELKAFIKKTKPLLKEMQGAMPKAKVGIVFSYDQEYAMQIQPHHPDLNYVAHIMKYYKALFDRNIPVDFVNDAANFEKYDLLIAPLQYLMPAELESKYCEYVKNGGNLVMDMRAGVKDEFNLCRTNGALPAGELRQLLGIEVPEYDCLRQGNGFASWGGVQYPCEKWSDVITLKGAQALAAYDTEYYAGTPAVTVNQFGKGKAYYVGTEPGEKLAARLVEEWKTSIGLNSLGETTEGVEITHRTKGEKTYIFVINHTGETKQVHIPAGWAPYYAGQTGSIASYAVEVYVV
ncbi:MAG: beta-galactosidase [Oscillospiraceae bacterium]